MDVTEKSRNIVGEIDEFIFSKLQSYKTINKNSPDFLILNNFTWHKLRAHRSIIRSYNYEDNIGTWNGYKVTILQEQRSEPKLYAEFVSL